MPDTDLQITIGADASGVVGGVAQAKAAIDGLAPSVTAMAKPFSELTEKLKTNDRSLHQLESSMNGLVSTFSRGLAQMALGSKSLAQVMRSLEMQVLDDLFKAVDGMVEKWAWGVTERVLASSQGQALLNALGLKDLAQEIAIEARKTAAVLAGTSARKAAESTAASTLNGQSLTQALLTVKQDAGKTFAGIFAALSQNPATLPVAAPLAAAGMATVLAVPLAAGGFDIPAGLNPLTQLHAQEMVLPARLANPMRTMMDDYAATRGGAGGLMPASGGDTHIHNYSISAMDAGSFKTFLRGNKNPLSLVLQEMGRAGIKTA